VHRPPLSRPLTPPRRSVPPGIATPTTAVRTLIFKFSMVVGGKYRRMRSGRWEVPRGAAACTRVGTIVVASLSPSHVRRVSSLSPAASPPVRLTQRQALIQAQTPRTTCTSSSRAERVSGLARPAADVEIKDIRLSSNARSRLIPPHDTARYEGPHSTRSRPPQRKGVSASSRMCPDQILVGRSRGL
jgi:hypothetical protein